jgi:hypothetical protein
MTKKTTIGAASFPTNEHRSRWARKALDAYKRETGFFDEPAEILLRYLIADLGHLASREGVDFIPIIARAKAYWLQERTQAKTHPSVKS